VQFLFVDKTTTVNDLRQFLVQAGPHARLRRDGDMLYCRDKRKGDAATHAVQHFKRRTQQKRGEVMDLVAVIFNNDGVDLKAHTQMVLRPKERAHLMGGAGDLKAEHLWRVCQGTVHVGGEAFNFERLSPPFKQGAYGKIYKAVAADGRELALKAPQKQNAATGGALQREAAVHLQAWRGATERTNYVVGAHAAVPDHTGNIYQPMELAVCSANKLKGKFRMPEDGDEVDCVAVQAVRDLAKGVAQMENAGLAHRDYKPENVLLCQDGVMRVTDFGTGGDPQTPFKATGKHNYRLTGNESSFNKSPEWLRSESLGAKGTYTVGHETDVFALGAASFQLLFNHLPFMNPNAPEHTQIGYEEAVLAYADSGLPFCQWVSENHGVEVPTAWQQFFDMTLHSNPRERATAHELLDMPLLSAQMPVEEAELRARLLALAGAQPGEH
jgi:hypothetical protein